MLLRLVSSRNPDAVGGGRKTEEELDVKIFERSANEVDPHRRWAQTSCARRKACWSRRHEIKEIAKRGKDPLAGALTLGVIYTIGPYLLPDLARQSIAGTPQYAAHAAGELHRQLLEMLRTGEIDCAILAEPFPDTGLAIAPLYDELFLAAVRPAPIPWPSSRSSTQQLKNETHVAAGRGPLLS